ncbi:MAG: hypothetical protein LBV14_13515 [Acidovorax sp.]|jgi:hypothetical protein|nr:hypothetical protein [Acidovorax sp.]
MKEQPLPDVNEWHPQFVAAGAQVSRLIEAHGEAILLKPEHAHLLEAMETYAPTPEIKAAAAEMLRRTRFAQARAEIERIAAEHGRRAACRPEYAHLFTQMMLNAPDELADYALQTAMEMDLLPKASHVDADGNPVYSIQEVAGKLGVSVEQVERDIQALGLDAAPAQSVHRLQ